MNLICTKTTFQMYYSIYQCIRNIYPLDIKFMILGNDSLKPY